MEGAPTRQRGRGLARDGQDTCKHCRCASERGRGFHFRATGRTRHVLSAAGFVSSPATIKRKPANLTVAAVSASWERRARRPRRNSDHSRAASRLAVTPSRGDARRRLDAFHRLTPGPQINVASPRKRAWPGHLLGRARLRSFATPDSPCWPPLGALCPAARRGSRPRPGHARRRPCRRPATVA